MDWDEEIIDLENLNLEELFNLDNFIELRNRNIERVVNQPLQINQENLIINLNLNQNQANMAFKNRVGGLADGNIINPLWNGTGDLPAPDADGTPARMPKQMQFSIKFMGDPTRLADFLTDYAMHADAYGWSEAVRIMRLPLHMEGVARRVVLDVPIADKTWNGIGRILNEKLLTDTPARIHRQMLLERVQKPNETVQQFAYDLKMLVVRAYPENFTEAQRNDFLMEQFLRGLKKEYQTHVVLSGADTFEIALKRAHTMEYAARRNDSISAITAYGSNDHRESGSLSREYSREQYQDRSRQRGRSPSFDSRRGRSQSRETYVPQTHYQGYQQREVRDSRPNNYRNNYKANYNENNNPYNERRNDFKPQTMMRRYSDRDNQNDRKYVSYVTPRNNNSSNMSPHAKEFYPKQVTFASQNAAPMQYGKQYANNFENKTFVKQNMYQNDARSRTNIEGDQYCETCRKMGHLARTCPLNRSKFNANYNLQGNVKPTVKESSINSVQLSVQEREMLEDEILELKTRCERMEKQREDDLARARIQNNPFIKTERHSYRKNISTMFPPDVGDDGRKVDPVEVAFTTLSTPNVEKLRVKDALEKLIKVTVPIEKLERIVPLLIQYAEETSPYRATVKILLQRYGEHLRKNARKSVDRLNVVLELPDKSTRDFKLHFHTKAKKLRTQIQSIIQTDDILLLVFCGQQIDDDEYLIECGVLPQIGNKIIKVISVPPRKSLAELMQALPQIVPIDIEKYKETMEIQAPAQEPILQIEQENDVELLEISHEEIIPAAPGLDVDIDNVEDEEEYDPVNIENFTEDDVQQVIDTLEIADNEQRNENNEIFEEEENELNKWKKRVPKSVKFNDEIPSTSKAVAEQERAIDEWNRKAQEKLKKRRKEDEVPKRGRPPDASFPLVNHEDKTFDALQKALIDKVARTISCNRYRCGTGRKHNLNFKGNYG